MLTLMKQSILILVITSSVFAHAKNPNSYLAVKNRVKKIRQKDLKTLVRNFIKESRPSRLVGTPGHKNAQKFIIDYLKANAASETTSITELTFKPKVSVAEAMYMADFERQVAQKFKPSNPVYKKWSAFTNNMISFIKSKESHNGVNIVWTHKGTNPSAGTVYIGAHYDTMSNDPASKNLTPNERQPGADDNASGVAVGLLLAKMLNQISFEETIKIVFFDWEELGFLGSEAFVRENLSDISKGYLGYINLEMLGHDSKSTDKEKKKGNMKLYIRKPNENGHKEDRLLAESLASKGESMTPGIDFSITANSFNSSDHLYFWKNNLHAVTFTQNWEADFNPNYHTNSDIPETLNMDTLYNSYRYIANALIAKLLKLKR
jgi:hypothetical protein